MAAIKLTVGEGLKIRAFIVSVDGQEIRNLNVFEYSASCERQFENYLAMCAKDMTDDEGNLTTYKRQTTFYADLSIGEWFGEKGIRETFDNAMKYWINDMVYFTEFVCALNVKLNLWYQMGYEQMARLYDELWRKADSAFIEKHQDNEKFMSYFYHVLD